jgi:PAS domain S-box-containing protein
MSGFEATATPGANGRRSPDAVSSRIEYDLLRSVLRFSPVPISVFDLRGRILLVSRSYEAILGARGEDIVGKSFADLLPPDVVERFTQRLAQLQETRTALDVEDAIRVGDQLRTFATRLFPLFDADGRHTANCGIAIETTERSRAKERLQQIIDEAPFGAHTYELMPDGRLVFAVGNRSATAILGIDHSELVGKTLEEAFPALACSEVPARYRQVAATGETFHADEMEYTDGRVAGVFEVHAVQTGHSTVTAFFRDVRELAHAYDLAVEGWSRAMDLRDKETEGHTRRVTELTARLAAAMGLSEHEILQVRRGALLHDVGKMAIPDHILLKTGPLTDAEWAVMRKHPEHAYELLRPITFLRGALDIPYCHHEKWDGTGYPRGLKGAEIPLTARLFAVADVYDALCSERPYREAWPHAKVLAHIRSLSGTHFDPEAVEVFLRVASAPADPAASTA